VGQIFQFDPVSIIPFLHVFNEAERVRVPSKDNPHLVILSTNMEHTAESNCDVVLLGNPDVPRGPGAGNVFRGTVRVWLVACVVVYVGAVPYN